MRYASLLRFAGKPIDFLVRTPIADGKSALVVSPTHFEGHRITGRNLNSESRPQVLLQNILRHRGPWIQEADGATALEATKEAPVIEGLEIK